MARARAQTRHACTGDGGGAGCSGDPAGLLSQNLKMSFSSPCSTGQYETDAPASHVTEDKHGLWSEKVRNLGGFFSAVIG